MSEKRTLQAQYDFLVLPALHGGIASLEDWERAGIAMLYVKETRKAAFRYNGADDEGHMRAFLEHARANFVELTDLKVVLDFQSRLLATAQDLAQRPHPIEAVILYATWCEHWLNATLITAGLDRGLQEEEVVQMVRDANLRAKLGWLWRTLQLPEFPEHLRNAVIALSEVRNEHVHYKWKGHDPDLLSHESSRLKACIANISDVVEGILDFEVDRLVGPYIAVANRLFATDIGPQWKQLALTRPMSAPRLVEM